MIRRYLLASLTLLSLLLVLVSPYHAIGQSQLINGDRVLVGTLNFCPASFASNTYSCNLFPAITAYITGARYLFSTAAANTGATSLNLNSIGAKTIKKYVGGTAVDLVANDILSGQYIEVAYDGTNMQILSPLANFPAQLAANGANCTVTGTFPNGVDASGVAENCVALSGSLPKTATYSVVVGDFDTYKTIPVASGTFTLTLPAAANQPTAGKYIKVINYGSGVVTIARVDTTINGGTASLTLPAATALEPAEAFIISDGTNYFASVNTLTQSSVKTLTNTTLDAEGTGNVLSLPSHIALPAAGCQNATAGSFWDLPTTTPAVAACVTGTNIQKGVLDYADTSGGFSAQTTLPLPATWTTTGGVDVRVYWTTTATTGNAKWTVQFVCTDVAATATDDPAFPASGNGFNTVTTAAPGTASRVQTSAIAGATVPASCVTATAALLHIRLFRDGNDAADTIAATARFVAMEVVIRRAL